MLPYPALCGRKRRHHPRITALQAHQSVLQSLHCSSAVTHTFQKVLSLVYCTISTTARESHSQLFVLHTRYHTRQLVQYTMCSKRTMLYTWCDMSCSALKTEQAEIIIIRQHSRTFPTTPAGAAAACALSGVGERSNPSPSKFLFFCLSVNVNFVKCRISTFHSCACSHREPSRPSRIPPPPPPGMIYASS